MPDILKIKLDFQTLSEKIIGAAFEVLGIAFLEKVCKNALNVELKLRIKPRVEIRRIINGIGKE